MLVNEPGVVEDRVAFVRKLKSFGEMFICEVRIELLKVTITKLLLEFVINGIDITKVTSEDERIMDKFILLHLGILGKLKIEVG